MAEVASVSMALSAPVFAGTSTLSGARAAGADSRARLHAEQQHAGQVSAMPCMGRRLLVVDAATLLQAGCRLMCNVV